jgi:acyl dehydratase
MNQSVDTVENLYRGTNDLWQAKVGDELGALPFNVPIEAVRRNAWANDDYNPWYVIDSPFGKPIVSPVFLASFDAQLFYGYYAYPEGGSLFAKQEFEYIEPVFVGNDYVIEGQLSEIYERKGRTFFKATMAVRGSDGTVAMKMAKTIAAPVSPRAL